MRDRKQPGRPSKIFTSEDVGRKESSTNEDIVVVETKVNEFFWTIRRNPKDSRVLCSGTKDGRSRCGMTTLGCAKGMPTTRMG